MPQASWPQPQTAVAKTIRKRRAYIRKNRAYIRKSRVPMRKSRAHMRLTLPTMPLCIQHSGSERAGSVLRLTPTPTPHPHPPPYPSPTPTSTPYRKGPAQRLAVFSTAGVSRPPHALHAHHLDPALPHQLQRRHLQDLPRKMASAPRGLPKNV